MLEMTLATWLLAAAAPLQPQLTLQPDDHNHLELTLCFHGSGEQVRYELKVRSHGNGGTSQSGQTGALIASQTQQCPVRNRIGLTPGRQVEAELRWWIEGAEQPLIRKTWPTTRSA